MSSIVHVATKIGLRATPHANRSAGWTLDYERPNGKGTEPVGAVEAEQRFEDWDGAGALERPRQTHDALARFLANGSIED